jgi:hypothetical protein
MQWPKLLGKCQALGYKSHDASHSCGLHVHINRSFMDRRFADAAVLTHAPSELASMSLLKLVCFVYGHSTEFVKLARRNCEQYARITAVTAPKSFANLKREVLLKPGSDLNRYQALNFRNAHTVEWRLFQGTLKEETFLATLELVDAASRFVLETGVAQLFNHADSWVKFCEFVHQRQKKPYLHLEEYMKLRKVWKE